MKPVLPAVFVGLVALGACVPEPPPPASAEAQAACRTEVMFETNNPTVNITSSESQELNSIVRMTVGEEAAPWLCVVDLQGNAQIQSLSNEGFL